jgi:dipeptidyl aminopeptidase/acylaminoacyl peptidase
MPEYAKGADIRVVGTEHGTSQTITEGSRDNWLPTWSPDGRYLAFLSDRDGGSQAKLWVWCAATHALRQVSEVNVISTQLQWLPNSEAVLVGISPNVSAPSAHVTHAFNPGEPRTSTPTVTIFHSSRESTPLSAQSPPWSLDGGLPNLALIDMESGKVRRIDGVDRVSAFFLSPDGARVAYTSPQAFERPGSQQVLFNVVLASLSGDQPRVVASKVQLETGGASLSWSPDGSLLAFRTGGMSGNGDCYIVDARLGLLRNASSFQDRHHGFAFVPPSWDRDGKYLYFTDGDTLWKTSVAQTKAVEVIRIPQRQVILLVENKVGILWSPRSDGSIVVLAFDKASKRSDVLGIDPRTPDIKEFLTIRQPRDCVASGQFGAVSPDGRQFAYFSQDAQHDMDLWLTDSSFTDHRRLTHVNPQFDRYKMGAARLIEWRSLDGNPLRGTLLLPADYREGNRYPLIVWVYGGQHGSDSIDRFGLSAGATFNLQLLATRGYAVLFPDAPQRLGTPMLDLAKTVLPGVDKVIEMGIADPSRMGVMGHSYGGYSVLALIVQTGRFKAAVTADGYGDLITQYGEMSEDGAAFGTSSQEQGQGLMGGTPWDFRQRYIDNSPWFFLDRVETALLVIQGDQDEVVAPFLSDQVFVGLRRLGKEVEYAKYKGEGHSAFYWALGNRVDYCSRVIAWFDKYVKAGRN